MQIAEYQVARYKVAKEELIVLRLRLEKLKQEAEGKQNAKLETEITYYENRIQALSKDLSDMEKQYA
jgi:predicted RNase H-like nuclease (RuvC/YqgF family)